MLYQGDTFETNSVQYSFDQDKKPNNLTIVKFSDSITAKIVRAGNKKYLRSRLDRKRNLDVKLENMTNSSGLRECRDGYQKTKDQVKNKADLKESHPEEA